jgi:2-octaprenyl-6-methoxyphenol hydroxylase
MSKWLSSPARDIAYERFTAEGPLAVLPRFDGNYAIVWAAPVALAAALQSCDDGEFTARLQQRLGWRIGHISAVGHRFRYELSLARAEASIAQRTAVIGNAAQALHPIAAQGFNLGLRDAAVIAELIADATDPGAPEVLQQFARRRSADRNAMIAFTDRLVRVFGDQRPLVSAARDLGLLLFDLLPPAKQALSRLSWGFGPLPRLSRGLPVADRQ